MIAAFSLLPHAIAKMANAANVAMAVEYQDATGEGSSYVKVSTPDTALSSISSVAAARRRTVARYYDGQYREKQAVQAYGSGSGKDLVLPRSSPVLHLLQRIRDEAHRFAISYHRSLHQRNALLSVSFTSILSSNCCAKRMSASGKCDFAKALISGLSR